jgi:hypothetical protein
MEGNCGLLPVWIIQAKYKPAVCCILQMAILRCGFAAYSANMHLASHRATHVMTAELGVPFL